MKLSELVQGLPFAYAPFDGDAEIEGVVADSRRVQPGYLFVAVAGGMTDGHRYIPMAVERGAAAVVGSQADLQLSIPYVQVDDSRKALAFLAAAFHGYPARKLTMIGVTGTDGKTTTTNMIYRILQAAGCKAGMISTINAVFGEQVLDTGYHVTTPDSTEVQAYLAQMVEAGITHVVLEVTSHGLVQNRVEACEFDVAVITNITHEHLDYHGSYEAYREAKAGLFTRQQETQPKAHGSPHMAVLNRDDASYDYLSQVVRGPTITYGFHSQADVRPQEVTHLADGMQLVVAGRGLKFDCHLPLQGDFNISNCLAALCASVYAMDIPPEAAARGIASLNYIPGRMEKLDQGQDFTAIVDFAHTPNALHVALETARKMTHGRLIAVFGSAGLRDREKRRMMAETSVELADLTILTAEDPRTESLEVILAEMAAGAASRGGVEGETFWRVPDRGEAIRFAVGLAQKGDLVIACGKGHEQSMCFGEVEYPWDDRTAMRAALAERLGIAGPQMPYLPTQEI